MDGYSLATYNEDGLPILMTVPELAGYWIGYNKLDKSFKVI